MRLALYTAIPVILLGAALAQLAYLVRCLRTGSIRGLNWRLLNRQRSPFLHWYTWVGAALLGGMLLLLGMLSIGDLLRAQ